MTGAVDAERWSRGAPSAGDVWTILRMILWSAEYLTERGVDSGRLDAEHLLAEAVGAGRLQLYLEHERPLTPDELERFRPLLKRRARREPLQYILGRQPFRELDLEITPDVLIPRPETEVLVGEVLDWARARPRGAPRALDVGTGSGAIALSLAFEGSFASVLATDIDEGALGVARRNRDAAGLADRVELRLGPLFDPVRPEECFDVIVSNPPYVAESEADALQPEIVEWEPRAAVFGGADGLDVIRALVAGAASRLAPGGLLALEVGSGQAEAVLRLIGESETYAAPSVRRDYAGKERIVLAKTRGE